MNAILEINLELKKKIQEQEKIISNLLKSNELLKKNQCLTFNSSQSFFQLRNQQKRNRKKSLRKYLSKLNEELKKIDLCLSTINIVKNTQEPKNFELNISEIDIIERDVSETLFWKDKLYIGDFTYHTLKVKLRLPLPSIKKIKKHRKLLNSQLEKFTFEHKNFILVDIRSRIESQINYFLENNKNNSLVRNNKIVRNENEIWIKISSDGTNSGRNEKHINITFTLINEINKCKTASGNYYLGMIQGKETYDNIKLPFFYIMKEIESFQTFNFNNKEYKIKYFLTADLKMLHILLGLNASNSNYSCPCCHMHKKKFHEIDYLFCENNSRSIDIQKEILEKFQESADKNHFGYVRENILAFIGFDNIIIDVFHLTYRCLERLFFLFVRDCIEIDDLDPKVDRLDFEKHLLLKKLFDFLIIKCKKNVEPSLKEEKGVIKICRDFTKKEYVTIFKKINIIKYINIDKLGENRSLKTMRLWNDFLLIITKIKKNAWSSTLIRKKTNEWFKLFSNIYVASDYTTPYIHFFTSHIHSHVEKFSDINLFNLEGFSSIILILNFFNIFKYKYYLLGLEKLNDQTTSSYFRSCNKKKTVLKQILFRRLRIEKKQFFESISIFYLLCRLLH